MSFEKLKYKQLFLVRHGAYENHKLSQKGVEQVKQASELILPLLNQETYITPFSSTERRAVDSLWVLQENLIHNEGYSFSDAIVNTHPVLAFGGNLGDYEEFMRFANKMKRGKIFLGTTHSGSIEPLSNIMMQEYLQKELPDYKFQYADGFFIDFESKDAKILSLEKGVIDL